MERQKHRNSFILLCVFLTVFWDVCCLKKPQNFVFILTDDQDFTLGGMHPLVKTKKIIQDKGAEFKNMFVTSPLCCPSRASILSGCYVHNHGVMNNSLSGNCSSYYWQATGEKKTFITYLKEAGYTTFFAGKYLNQYGHPLAGGSSHVPPGWDHWLGLVGNSRYYNYSLSVNGKVEYHGSDPSKDYLTDLLFHRAANFLSNYSSEMPFFLMICPPAPHSPFTPSPAYKKAFQTVRAPRTPNFHSPPTITKHWLLRQPPHPLPKAVISAIDETYRNRWRTLLSVDDGTERLYSVLKKKKLLHKTFLVFSSDNGFHLGQFSLPWDKRQLYEFDIRVPLLIRGPGIKHGLKIEEPVLNIDLAPTFLTLAGIKPPNFMDGVSLFTYLWSSRRMSKGRQFLVEHTGEATNGPVPECPQYKAGEVHTCDIDCICEDSRNNTYDCLRTIFENEDTIYCRFHDMEEFIEFYNLTSDPYQLKNLYYSKPSYHFVHKDGDMFRLMMCRGKTCS